MALLDCIPQNVSNWQSATELYWKGTKIVSNRVVYILFYSVLVNVYFISGVKHLYYKHLFRYSRTSGVWLQYCAYFGQDITLHFHLSMILNWSLSHTYIFSCNHTSLLQSYILFALKAAFDWISYALHKWDSNWSLNIRLPMNQNGVPFHL